MVLPGVGYAFGASVLVVATKTKKEFCEFWEALKKELLWAKLDSVWNGRSSKENPQALPVVVS
jgi:hypothetical protein